ncbi:hypothetical protein [Pigmentiphaga litoralis]|uniref:Uncharacterized protein n=1 Tax=Pigmentiphaga litoralis TaxID=516702 RepID=A0A7Y9LNV5_9BURK|nr:hypothetical protein [Pigmentiphaga litoralis]NYE23179.1 hypothetical protein [Pigmentiphaga litoralis]NYE83206.1 hypothetical protein [Pigmentiphaga litoralis]
MRPVLHTLAVAVALTLAAATSAVAQSQPAVDPAAAAAQVTTAVAATPPVALRLAYENRSIGTDGVTRDSRHADLMFRDKAAVWIERELPAALRESEHEGHQVAHGPHAGHAHDDAQGAPLLIQREPDGKVAVKSILHKQKRVIDVELAHQANVGYGGSWAAAYWLLDPVALTRMEKLGAGGKGVERYRLVQGERTTLVDWDVAGKYARRIEQKDAHGLSRQVMTASAIAMPKVMPWQKLNNYSRGDYSDLLD